MKAITLLTAATVTFAGLALAPRADAQVIKIDGSSTVFPITEAVAEEFQIQNRGKVRVRIEIHGPLHDAFHVNPLLVNRQIIDEGVIRARVHAQRVHPIEIAQPIRAKDK